MCEEVKLLCLDHDHETGKFRGWLCLSCNLALGNLGDSIEEAERRIKRYKEWVSI